MSLTICSDCGRNVSTAAPTCLGCGRPGPFAATGTETTAPKDTEEICQACHKGILVNSTMTRCPPGANLAAILCCTIGLLLFGVGLIVAIVLWCCVKETVPCYRCDTCGAVRTMEQQRVVENARAMRIARHARLAAPDKVRS